MNAKKMKNILIKYCVLSCIFSTILDDIIKQIKEQRNE